MKFKVRAVFCLIISFPVFLIGCNFFSNTFEDKVAAFIKKGQFNTDSTKTFRLSEVTNFKWDRLIFFETSVSKPICNEAIGQSYNTFVEGTRPLIFLYRGKVVHFENLSEDQDLDPLKNQLYLQGVDTSTKNSVRFDLIKPDDKFSVQEFKSGGTTSYTLFLQKQ